jgi:single-strand selective monofunctional uracil DNA glycosylase
VRDELEIPDLPMITPSGAHPKRPIVGLSQARQEVSGQRIWSLLFEVYGSPLGAMKEVFLVNHCPLLLLNERGANVTPDKVPASVVGPVFEACDDHLREVVDVLGATRIVGVGAYASNRAQRALGGSKGEGLSPDGRRVRLDKYWHPSPASPLANRNGGADWRAQVRSVLLRDEEMN